MKSKLITILATLAILTAGCGKSPNTNSNASQPAQPTPPPIQAEPFHGQVYKSLNGRTTLTLVSKDECELSEGGTILLCKYTKPNDTLRVVTTALGTSQVIYFRFTAQGLVDNNGNVLFSPEGLTAKIQQQQLEQQRAADQKINSVRETQTIGTFSLSPEVYQADTRITPDQLVLTDVSVKLHYGRAPMGLTPETKAGNYIKVVNFASLDGYRIGDVNNGANNGFRLRSTEFEDGFELVECQSEADGRTVHDAVLNAFNAWKAKFPEVVLR